MFLSMSLSISTARGVILASVYLMAAGESPSMDPKLPWPSTSVSLSAKSCAMRASAPYTEESPWGWYFPRQSPTMRAHFLWGLSGVRPSSCMV